MAAFRAIRPPEVCASGWSLADNRMPHSSNSARMTGFGGSIPSTKQNLSQIIEQLQAEGIGSLLAGMMAPPNFGGLPSEFSNIFPALAETYEIPLYPFFPDGVAAELISTRAMGSTQIGRRRHRGTDSTRRDRALETVQ